MAFVWMDWQRQYFISTCSSLAEGSPYKHQQWRQLEDTSSDEHANPKLVDFVVPQPRGAEVYYETCAMIDCHNRHQLDALGIENKLVTQIEWGSIWPFFHDCCRNMASMQQMQGRGYGGEAEDILHITCWKLIDNRLYMPIVCLWMSTPRAELNQMIFDQMGDPRAWVSAHLTPKKRKKWTANGDKLPISLQCWCWVFVIIHMLCVRIAWSARQQLGFASTPRKESYAFRPT